MLEKQQYRILFNLVSAVALFVIVSLWYSYLYMHMLGLGMSPLSVLFLFCGLGLFLSISLFLPYRIAFWSGSFCFVCLFLFAQVNAVYLKIFNQFIPLDITWLAATRASGNFFLSYWHSLPGYFWIISGLYLFLAVCALRFALYAREIPGRAEDSLIEKKHFLPMFRRSIRRVTLIICILALLLSRQFVHHPRMAWWQPRVQAADLGYIGHLSTSAYRITHQHTLGRLFSNDAFPMLNRVSENIPRSPFAEASTQVIQAADALAFFSREEETTNPPIFEALGEQRPHIIFYQLESIASWLYALDPNPMPFLKSLEEQYLSVDNFIPNGCHTVHAELSSLCSLPPHSNNLISEIGLEGSYHCLPDILKEKWGYHSTFYHSNNASFYHRDTLGPLWGFDELLFTNHFHHKSPDRILIQDILDRMDVSPRPTFHHLISFTSHSPHINKQIALLRDQFGVDTPLYKEPLTPDIQARIQQDLPEDTQGYPWFARVVDEALEQLFQGLEDRRLRDNTIVVIFGDHRYYNFPEQDRLENFFDYNRLPFVIVTPDGLAGRLSTYAATADIPATVLHLLEGDSYESRDHFFGTSLLAEDHPNYSALSCLGYGHFINKDVLIQAQVTHDLYPVVKRFTPLSEKAEAEYQYAFEQYMEGWDQFLEHDFLSLSQEGKSIYTVSSTEDVEE